MAKRTDPKDSFAVVKYKKYTDGDAGVAAKVSLVQTFLNNERRWPSIPTSHVLSQTTSSDLIRAVREGHDRPGYDVRPKPVIIQSHDVTCNSHQVRGFTQFTCLCG